MALAMVMAMPVTVAMAIAMVSPRDDTSIGYLIVFQTRTNIE